MARLERDRQTRERIGGGPSVVVGTTATERPIETTTADRAVGVGDGGA